MIIAAVATNVERVEEAFARFNETGEFDFAWTDPDIELHDRPDVPDSTVWHGIEGARSFFAKTADAFDPIRWEPEELTATGRHVVVQTRIVATGRTSGMPIEVGEGQLWTFSDGRLVRLQGFPTVDDAYAKARELDAEEAA